MRYITNADDYLVAVSFGADIECEWGICTQYEGEVPDDYSSLDAWYLAECERLWKWKIVDGSLVYDAEAAPPEEEPVEDFTDSVIEQGIAGVWPYRTWRSGNCELWTKTNVLPPSSIQEGGCYYSDICTLDLPFHVTEGVVTGSAHFLHWVANAEVWEDGWIVGFRLMRSAEVYTDTEVPVQLYVQGVCEVEEPDSGLTVEDDGAGNVTITAYGTASIEDDGAGNVNIVDSGTTSITDDGAGNVTII